MTKSVLYSYLGTNGTILSPVHLEGIYSVRKIKMVADKDKQLTKDGVNFVTSVTVPEEESSLWYEV